MFFHELPIEIVSIIILYLNINQTGFLLSGTNRKCNEIVSKHSFWIDVLSDFDLSHLIYNRAHNYTSNLLSLDKFVNELSWIRNLSITNKMSASLLPSISFSPNRCSFFKKECHKSLINVWTKNIHQLQKHYNIIKNSIYNVYLFIRNYYECLHRDIEYCKNNSDELYKDNIKKKTPIKIKSYQHTINGWIDKIYQIKTIIDNIIKNNKTFYIDKFQILDIEYYIPFQIIDTEQYRYIHFLEIEVSIILVKSDIKGLYRGPLKEGKPNGFGSLITINNEYYRGLFQDGYYCGEGILVDIDLQYILADWYLNRVVTIIDYFVIT